MKLWDSVCVTNPDFTKKANVAGNKITSIVPQYQIKIATEKFGSYGKTWGFKEIDYNYSLKDYGLVVFKAIFFYPDGEFVISNSIKIWKDNAKTKLDDDFAKKCETDALTKALSKLGFNADIFLGYFDDMRYVNDLKQELKKDSKTKATPEHETALLNFATEGDKTAMNKSCENIQFSKEILKQAREILNNQKGSK